MHRIEKRPYAIAGAQVQAITAIVTAQARLQAGSDVIPLGGPAVQSGFKTRVGNVVCAGSARAHFNVVHQALANIQQPQLDQVNRAVIVIGAVVQHAGNFEIGPGGFDAFIAIRPIIRQPMIGARMDQLKTAAAAVGPLPPTAAHVVGHLVLHHQNPVRAREPKTVGHHPILGPGQRQPPALVRQFAGEVSHRVAGTELRITAEEAGLVARHNQIRAQIHRIGPLIVKLYILVIVIAGDGLIHDLVQDDGANEDVGVRRSRRAGGQGIELSGPVRPSPAGHVQTLGLIRYGVEHSAAIRCPPGWVECKTHLCGVKDREPTRAND